MRNVLYPKLAANNIKKNKKTYFPYLLTCLLTVMMFYDLLLVSTNPALNQMPGATDLRLILNFAVSITGGFSAIFLFYTNSFLIRQRKKEMGLYQVLGMDKKNLTKMMVWESIYTAGAGILGGILAGIVFGRLIFLVLLKLIRFDVAFRFSVEPEAILITAVLFGGIFLVVLLWNIFQVQRVNPVELLQGARKGEKEPKANWLIAVLGILLLGTGYYIAQTTESPLSAIVKFFIAVILVILGTYALFTAGSVALLKLLRKNKSYYYQTRHFISISGLIYRMKQNAVGLANICIMSTIVLVLVSVTASLYIGMEDIMNTRFKTEFSAVSGDTSLKNIETMNQIVEEELHNHGLQISYEQKYRYVPLSAMKQDNELEFDVDSGNGYDADAMRGMCVIPLADYNALEGTNVSLAQDEVLTYFPDEEFDSGEIVVGGETYHIKENLKESNLQKKKEVNVTKNVYLIVADETAAEHMIQLYGPTRYPITMQYLLNFDMKGDEAAKSEALASMKTRMETNGEVSSCYVEYREAYAQEFYGVYGGFLFLGIFVGFLFLMATVLIIYYKQISEGYDDQERYQIMQKVGMSRKEVKGSIRSQILTVFFVPLLMAILHVTVAFKPITKLLLVFNLSDTHLSMVCTIAVAAVFAMFYVIVFAITSREYYKIVK